MDKCNTVMTPGMGIGGREAGLTLIEILMAMTILSIGLLGLVTLQVAGVRNTRLSGSSTHALYLAQGLMEQILNAEFGSPHLRDVNPGNNQDLDNMTNIDYVNVDAAGRTIRKQGYTLIWNVADNVPIQGTKTFVVMAAWQDGRHCRRLRCIKTPLPAGN